MFKALKIAALARYSKTKTEISDSQGHSGLPTEDHWHTTVFVQTGIVIQHLTFKKPERALVAVSYFLFFEMPLFFKQLLIVVGFITSASGPRELHGACKLDHVAGHRNQVYHDCYKCGNGHAVCYSSSHKLTATILTAQRSLTDLPFPSCSSCKSMNFCIPVHVPHKSCNFNPVEKSRYSKVLTAELSTVCCPKKIKASLRRTTYRGKTPAAGSMPHLCAHVWLTRHFSHDFQFCTPRPDLEEAGSTPRSEGKNPPECLVRPS